MITNTFLYNSIFININGLIFVNIEFLMFINTQNLIFCSRDAFMFDLILVNT